MTDAELRAILADLAKRQAEEHAKTEAVLRQVTKQLGGLGNKFGSFTEGLAFDSMRRILKRNFGAEVVSSRTKASRGENPRSSTWSVCATGRTAKCIWSKSKVNSMPKNSRRASRSCASFSASCRTSKA